MAYFNFMQKYCFLSCEKTSLNVSNPNVIAETTEVFPPPPGGLEKITP